MNPDELDRILSSESPLEPASGFAMDVMSAIRREAAEPAPVRFPWGRFAIGVSAAGVMAGAGTAVLHSGLSVSRLAPLVSAAPELGYGLTAVLVTLGLVSLPRLLAALDGDAS